MSQRCFLPAAKPTGYIMMRVVVVVGGTTLWSYLTISSCTQIFFRGGIRVSRIRFLFGVGSVSPGSDFSFGWDPELLTQIWLFLCTSTLVNSNTVFNFTAAGLLTKSVLVLLAALRTDPAASAHAMHPATQHPQQEKTRAMARMM